MSIIRVAGFLGANKALQPMLLPETVGTVCENIKPGRGDMRPWKVPLNVATVPASRQTIYRMGRDVASDSQYWLSWTTDVHAVVGGNADDTAERTYFTGSGTPKWTNTTLALATAPYPTAARELGVPAPASACTLIASGGVSEDMETRFYTYTYVSDIGEESAPAAPSLQLTCKADDTVTINSLAAAPAGNYGITLIRVYRTQDSSNGADFYFLREIASTLTTTTDDNRDLGEALATTTWLVPDAGMKFLTGLWNGMMAGIVGRSVRFCEAYVYYAWPIAYEILPTNAQPVALATYGQNLVMLTNGNPSIITGSSPESMDEQPVEFNQACIAPKSAVGMGHGVAWAAPDGLAYIGQGGARLLTQSIMTRDDWQAINPSSIVGTMYEGQYFGFYNDGSAKCFILDPANPQGMYFLDFGCTALYLDPLQDALYILNTTSVLKFDAGATYKTATFKSKLFHQPAPIPGFACAKVVAEAFPVTFKLYADGVLKHTQTVANALPFRLPSGYRAQDYQIEISGTTNVQLVAMAHSMQELGTT